MATGNKNIWVGILIFIVIFIVIIIWVFGGDKMTSNFIKKLIFNDKENMTCDAGEKMVGLNASGAVCTFDYGSYSSGGGGGIGQEFDPLWSVNYTYFNNSWSDTYNSTINISIINFINTKLNISDWNATNTSYRLNSNSTFYENINMTKSLNITENLHVDGNVSMKRPYGTFTDMNIQTVPVINTAYNMSFNFTEDTYLVRKYPDNYTFTTPISGDYLITISILAQTSTPGDRIYIWIRHNNIDIPRSTTLYDFKSSNANTVIAVPFIIDLEANDNFSIQYAGTATDIKIMSYNKTAFAPETPGAIMTVSKISEITD
jgi:hypothetical protein